MAKFDDDLTEIEYKGSNLFKSPTIANCWHCGDLTYWIDINFEAHLCSEECEDAKWDEFYEDTK
jgi:hypothetical protein